MQEQEDTRSDAGDSTALAPYSLPTSLRVTVTRETIKRAAGAANMPDEQFEVFLAIAQRSGLDPLARQIYAIPRQSRRKDENGHWQTETAWTIQTGIDGYRAIAARTGQLAGIDDPTFDSETDAHPRRATCTVWRFTAGQRVPFSASARWDEYVQTKPVYSNDGKRTDKTEATEMWSRMPYLMLGKCAEALALRRAFPAELGGIYTGEEMAQADNYVEAAATTTVREEPARSAPAPAHPQSAPTPQPSAQRAAAKTTPKIAERWGELQLRMRALGIIRMAMADEVALRIVDQDWMTTAHKDLDTDYALLLAYVEEQEAKAEAARARFAHGAAVGRAAGDSPPAGHETPVDDLEQLPSGTRAN